jgi:flagellar biosynthesis/type III secretory pathway M-ring protein FliF/YscJ
LAKNDIARSVPVARQIVIAGLLTAAALLVSSFLVAAAILVPLGLTYMLAAVAAAELQEQPRESPDNQRAAAARETSLKDAQARFAAAAEVERTGRGPTT